MKLYPNITQAIWIVAVFLILVVTACGPSKPSERDGKAACERRYNQKMKVVEFKKTNGQESNVFGVQIYKMSCLVTLECTSPEGCCLQIDWTARGACIEEIKPGGRFTRTGTIVFAKSEKGWLEQDFNMH